MPPTPNATPDAFRVQSSIPVLPMFDEARTRAFYVDFLGFGIEWEHRFRESRASPLYMQIRLGGATLHLNGHAAPDAAPSEVRLPVQGIEALLKSLEERVPKGVDVELVDPRGAGIGTDLNLVDPSGNLLTFWRANPDRS